MILNGIAPGIPGQVDDTFIPLVIQVPDGTTLLSHSGTTSTQATGTNTVATFPIVIHGIHTITALSCNVTTAGTGSTVVRLGIFNIDPATGKPGTLLVDAGTAAAVSTGVKTISGLLVPITPGLYWVAAAFQTVTGTPQMTIGTAPPIVPYQHNGLFAGEYGGYQDTAAGAFATSYGWPSKDTRGPLVGVTVS